MDESCFRGNYKLQQLTDIFSLPEMMLLANVVELLNSKEINFDPTTIFKDVEQAVREVHIESNHASFNLYNLGISEDSILMGLLATGFFGGW